MQAPNPIDIAPATSAIHERHWARAKRECDASPRAGLWARAFAEAGGEHAKAEALYIRWRASELRDEELASPASESHRPGLDLACGTIAVAVGIAFACALWLPAQDPAGAQATVSAGSRSASTSGDVHLSSLIVEPAGVAYLDRPWYACAARLHPARASCGAEEACADAAPEVTELSATRTPYGEEYVLLSRQEREGPSRTIRCHVSKQRQLISLEDIKL